MPNLEVSLTRESFDDHDPQEPLLIALAGWLKNGAGRRVKVADDGRVCRVSMFEHDREVAQFETARESMLERG